MSALPSAERRPLRGGFRMPGLKPGPASDARATTKARTGNSKRQEQATAKAECRGLSAVAAKALPPVEMTIFLGWVEENRQQQKQELAGEGYTSHPCRGETTPWMGHPCGCGGLRRAKEAERRQGGSSETEVYKGIRGREKWAGTGCGGAVEVVYLEY